MVQKAFFVYEMYDLLPSCLLRPPANEKPQMRFDKIYEKKNAFLGKLNVSVVYVITCAVRFRSEKDRFLLS